MFKKNNVEFYFSEIDNIDLDNFHFKLPDKLKNAHIKRQKEFLAGRYCIFEAAKTFNINLSVLAMSTKGAPIWPKELVGSISHTKGFVIGVVGLKKHFKSIGIDTEEIIGEPKYPVIEKNILTSSDYQFINNHKNQSKNELYTLIFSAKEALFKLIHPLTQNYFGFQEAHIVDINLEEKTFKICLDSNQSGLLNFNGFYEGEYEIHKNRIVTFLTL